MVQRSNGARASCGWCGMRSSASDRDRGGVGGGWGGRGVAWNLGPRERGNFWSPYQHHQWLYAGAQAQPLLPEPQYPPYASRSPLLESPLLTAHAGYPSYLPHNLPSYPPHNLPSYPPLNVLSYLPRGVPSYAPPSMPQVSTHHTHHSTSTNCARSSTPTSSTHPSASSSHSKNKHPPLRPTVHVAQPTREEGALVFSLLSYNVLAQNLLEKNLSLYRSDPELLSWEYRRENLLKELLQCNAQLMCLQEVQEEHYQSWFLPKFSAHGYEGVYQKRTGEYVDGCAIFYKREGFSLVEWKGLQYQHNTGTLSRDNVGIVAKFSMQSQSGDQCFCVATTHLLFNPKAGEIKLAQTMYLLAELHHLALHPDKERGCCPALLCGDFNSLPSSPLLRFICSSFLNYTYLSAPSIAGYSSRTNHNRRIPTPILPSTVGIGMDCRFACMQNREDGVLNCCDVDGNVCSPSGSSDKCSSVSQQSNESDTVTKQTTCSKYGSSQAEAKCGDVKPRGEPSLGDRKSIISHPFKFAPVYHYTDRPPATATTYHKSTCETVDYIFFTPPTANGQRRTGPGLRLLSRKALPSCHVLKSLGPQPHMTLSSDHLFLQAEFELIDM